jgi:hypothetical protein
MHANGSDSIQSAMKKSALRLTAACAFLSGISAAIGIVFLIIFYSDFEVYGQFGTMNDIMVIVQYSLMLPIAFVLYRLLRAVDAVKAQTNFMIGLGGMLAVIILQLFLVLDIIPFYLQIGPVILCFFIVLAWFILNRNLSQRDAEMKTLVPQNKALTILAGLVFGYPIWAYLLGRNFLQK